jgi:uncharacterized ferredoxin-like protein
MIISSEDAEKEVVLYVAKLMCAAARTAPKGRGADTIKTTILTGEEIKRLTDEMVKESKDGLTISIKSVQYSEAIVLIGVTFEQPLDQLANMKFKLIDLGIALGSAAKIASDLNVDNRIMAGPGRTAAKLGMMKADEVQSICLSIKGKNIFFDRPGYVAPVHPLKS